MHGATIDRLNFRDTYVKDPQTLRGSFFAVSRPNPASIFRYPQVLHTLAPLIAQNVKKLVDMFANVAGVCAVFCIPFSQFFRADLDETLSESIVFRKFIELSRTLKLLQFAEKSWKLTPSEKKRTSFWGW